MMAKVEELNGYKVGQLVTLPGSPVVLRIEWITPECGGLASFLPIRKDGQRDRRTGPFTGLLRGMVPYTKGAQ